MAEHLVALAGMEEKQLQPQLAGHADHSIFPSAVGNYCYYCSHCCCAGIAALAACVD